jgi:alginate O-acetyltransferase complex protein AlgI
MLAFIAVGLTVLKVVVVRVERARGMPPLGPLAWLGFLSWPGMRPRVFVESGPPDLEGARRLARRGALGLALGLAFLVIARSTGRGCALLLGLSATFHFGILNLLAAAWRRCGVCVDELFLDPWRAENLTEFWGRRWNRAFTAMSTTTLYRPLGDRLGRVPALLAAFAFSGLLHEMALSWPVQAGHGGPMAYFLLHGLLVLGERLGARRGLVVGGWGGRVWAAAALLLPLGWLFHPAAMAGLAWPLVGGATW